jgi:EAL domain-containing protein (putative c-di-GMP-specific phosphodiesterase class I)
MGKDDSDREIVHSTINLGHNLGLNVVAEGKENMAVMELVKGMGCDQVQGYYFSRPVESDVFTEIVRQNMR